MIINIGAGKKLIKGAVNVDMIPGEGIDKVWDFNNAPWPWKAGIVDDIFASHIIEHLKDEQAFIKECCRLLKPKGRLIITAPHSSSCSNVGCLGHYRTYSHNYFNNLLAEPNYIYDKPLFKTEKQGMRWWYEQSGDNVPERLEPFIRTVDWCLTPLINLSPRVFENLWCYWVGGAKEVYWVGQKI